MIPVAAIYVFLILAFFVARQVFWAALAVILLAFLIKPTLTSDLGDSVFTNLTWVALALVLVMLIIGIILISVYKKSAGDFFRGTMMAYGESR